MALTKNVGPADKNIRLAVAGVLILAGLMVSSMTMKVVLTVAGLVVLGTAIFGVCLAYYPLGINTNKS
jgi:hypothetical protein